MPMPMRSVRMPRSVIVAVMLCLFVAGLYGLRQYGQAGGSAEHVLLAIVAGLACLALVGGLIYANYTSYRTRAEEDHHINGTCQ